MNEPDEPVTERSRPVSEAPARSLRISVMAYAVIVVAYLALVGWWVYFFATQTQRTVEQLDASGVTLSAEQLTALEAESNETARMFLFEGGFIGLLMLGSMVFVLRALQRERMTNRLQRNFLAAVTHELRSPIASARLYLESLLLDRTPEAKREGYLRNAHQDLRRLGDMVEDLLEARRITESGLEFRPREVDLGELVERLTARSAELHPSATVTCVTDDGVVASVDPDAVEKIVNNLVSNGVKYGGDEPVVDVSLRVDGARAVLAVRDHGPGLRGADPERVLRAFERGGEERVRTQTGVGLGLFLVHECARAHGGHVQIGDGLEGGGTRVVVTLPLRDVRARRAGSVTR